MLALEVGDFLRLQAVSRVRHPIQSLGPATRTRAWSDAIDGRATRSCVALRRNLTLREARWLANADRVFHGPGVPAAILDRARADAARLPLPAVDLGGLSVIVEVM